MNILLCIDSLGSGGAQRQIVSLGCSLKQKGYDVSFFVYYPNDFFKDELDYNCIQVFSSFKKSRFSLMPLFSLVKIIRKNSYDLVLSFLDTPNVYLELAHFFIRRTKIIVSERSTSVGSKFDLYEIFKQKLHYFADVITVNSYHQTKLMLQHSPWMSNKIKTIHNGVDLDRFKPINIPNINHSKISLVAIGTISIRKNLLKLANSILICRDKYGLEIIVDWFGKKEDSPSGRSLYSEVNSFLHTNNLLSNWNWAGETRKVESVLPRYDALILPSIYEGLPNVVCEALSCGKPVLVSNVCDHPLLVQTGVTGFLFDPLNSDDIALKINQFAQLSVDKRIKMGLAARDFAEKNLSLERYVSDYENIFRNIIKPN